jgi:hypothetical protein
VAVLDVGDDYVHHLRDTAEALNVLSWDIFSFYTTLYWSTNPEMRGGDEWKRDDAKKCVWG